VTGIIHRDTTRPEFQRSYAAVVAQAEAEAALEGEITGERDTAEAEGEESEP
jgi:hypothetical protein